MTTATPCSGSGLSPRAERPAPRSRSQHRLRYGASGMYVRHSSGVMSRPARRHTCAASRSGERSSVRTVVPVTVRRVVPSKARVSIRCPVKVSGFPKGSPAPVSQSWTESSWTATASRLPSSENAMDPRGCPNRAAPGTRSLGISALRSRAAPSQSSSHPEAWSTATNRPSGERDMRAPGFCPSAVLRRAPVSRVTSAPDAVIRRSLSRLNTLRAERSSNRRMILRRSTSQISWTAESAPDAPNFMVTRDSHRPSGESPRWRGRWFFLTGMRWWSFPSLMSRTTTVWSSS